MQLFKDEREEVAWVKTCFARCEFEFLYDCYFEGIYGHQHYIACCYLLFTGIFSVAEAVSTIRYDYIFKELVES